LQTDNENISAISAFARYRQTVLARAGEILDPEHAVPLAERFDALPAVTGLLMTSLEELKVAEEELRDQNDVLNARKAQDDIRTRHYQGLFLHSPVPSFITDIRATILEINLAAAALFKREAKHLERKPLAALLAPAVRDEFRRQLARITPDLKISDWRLTLNRIGDTPVTVRAAVAAIPRSEATEPAVLYWALNQELLPV
jgi:PAS domain-containing protein